ncbi:MAG: mechanosensitive ion channel family protein [Akkermansiaceae bacterium]
MSLYIATKIAAVTQSSVPPTDEFTFSSFFENIRDALVSMAEDFALFIPKILLGIVLLFLGYVFAQILSRSVTTLFKKLGVDNLLEKAGVTGVLHRAGIKAAPGAVLAKLIFVISMLFVVKIAAQEASIKDISDIVMNIIAFMPNAITAAIIMLVGFVAADIIKNSLLTTLSAAGLDYANTLSKLVFGFIIILVLTVALSQINIQTELLNATVKIVLSAIGLGLALSLGLGLKDMAKNVVSGVYSRDLYKVGTVIEFEGESTVIAGVGPVTTKLKTADGGFIMVPNEKLISEPVRGRSAE